MFRALFRSFATERLLALAGVLGIVLGIACALVMWGQGQLVYSARRRLGQGDHF
ncbi:MAG: hypothetical protein H0W30_01465 [Gemmatimonadaceae bacterium]|nr:hypothetical protein [Gemmatimonadaceae bacterium]